MASGMMAGQALVAAKKSGDFSDSKLMGYQRLMEQSYVLKEHKRKKGYHSAFLNDERFFTAYPEVISETMRDILVVDGVDKGVKHAAARKRIRSKVGYLRLLRDMYSDVWSVLPW
jgi:electron transfer flavoprotein-quinone oxidoreductase